MSKAQVSAGTIARTICLFLALFNQIMTISGHAILPIEDETITELITMLATVMTAVLTWWKNNSFTQEARAADETMKMLKQKRQHHAETD